MSIEKISANWIWGKNEQHTQNCHMLVRKLFAFAHKPKACLCCVSASNIYELFINGQRVGRGPSPSNVEWQYYDSYDITDFVREGRNVVTAHCYNYGVDMESALKQNPGPGGFLFEMQTDGETEIVSDGTWRVLRDPSHKIDTEPISGHCGGFKDVFDARAELVGWMDADFDDSMWQDATVIGPAGCEPWTNLLPRDIPAMKTEDVSPRDVFYHTCGMAYGSPRYDVTWPEALVDDDNRVTVVDPLSANFAPTVLVDFGENVYGYFEIDISDGSGGILEVSYGESLNLTLLDTVIMRSGHQTYRCFERRGGRYLSLAFHNLPGPVNIRRVFCDRQSYPVEQLGSFRCSDEMLNRIWEVGAYTVRMCMQEHYEDCPWREQTLYTGDIAVGALLSYYAFGTQSLAKKCLTQFARIQNADGLIPSHGPANLLKRTYIPEYAAFWIMALHDYYMHWGDAELVTELHDAVEKCMSWYSDRIGSDGLFVPAQGDTVSHFVDNLSGISYTDRTAAEQIVICAAFARAARLAEVSGDEVGAKGFRKQAEEMTLAINQTFWRDDSHRLVDTTETDAANQITNGLALLYDIADEDKSWYLARLLNDRTDAPPVRAGYMNFYMVEALAKHGDVGAALQRIREYWGTMIARGATTFWETFDPSSRDGTLPERLWSQCHEFCAGPVYSLPAHLLGIRAIEPGFARVEIAPNLCGLDWAKAKVPTPHGVVEVICCTQSDGCTDLNILLPPNIAAEILVPLPGRDISTVYVDDAPIPEAWESRGHRLVREASHEAQHIRVRTSRHREFAPGGHIVQAPWGEWGSTPT